MDRLTPSNTTPLVRSHSSIGDIPFNCALIQIPMIKAQQSVSYSLSQNTVCNFFYLIKVLINVRTKETRQQHATIQQLTNNNEELTEKMNELTSCRSGRQPKKEEQLKHLQGSKVQTRGARHSACAHSIVGMFSFCYLLTAYADMGPNYLVIRTS